MSKELVAEELGNDLSSLESYEEYFNEYDEGELRLYVDEPVSNDVLLILEERIRSQGVVLTEPIVQDARVIFIKFRKELAPLAIIAIAAGAIFVIGGAILGFQIWKSVKLGVPLWAWGVGGLALLYLVMRTEPAKKAGGFAIKAGKVYITKKAVKA